MVAHSAQPRARHTTLPRDVVPAKCRRDVLPHPLGPPPRPLPLCTPPTRGRRGRVAPSARAASVGRNSDPSNPPSHGCHFGLLGGHGVTARLGNLVGLHGSLSQCVGGPDAKPVVLRQRDAITEPPLPDVRCNSGQASKQGQPALCPLWRRRWQPKPWPKAARREQRARPATKPSTADLQSTRSTAPGPPQDTACRMAHTSAPKIVRSHGGGTPCADARIIPNASNATKAQPHRRSKRVGPSRHEPSVYITHSPSTWPSGGCTTQTNVGSECGGGTS